MAEVGDGKAAGELNTRERREEVFLTLALNTIGPLISPHPHFFFFLEASLKYGFKSNLKLLVTQGKRESKFRDTI